MPLFKEAIQAVERNIAAIGIYVAILVALSLANLLYLLVFGTSGTAEPTQQQLLFGTIFDVIFALIAAIAQTLAFSRIGKDIDRPLWKVSGDREALQRYFVIWAVIGIFTVAVYRVLSMLGGFLDNDEFKLFALLVYIGMSSLATPIGACLMFARKPPLQEAPHALIPLMEQLPYTLLIATGNFAWFFFSIFEGAQLFEDPSSTRLQIIFLAMSIVTVFIDCVVFALVWLMCKDHRDNAGEDDFEF
jgi:hypothetical protein